MVGRWATLAGENIVGEGHKSHTDLAFVFFFLFAISFDECSLLHHGGF